MNKQTLSRRTFLGLVGTGALLVACRPPMSTSAVPKMNEIMIKGNEYAYDMPAETPAGLTLVRWENTGKELHHAQLARLNDGITFEQFTGALPKGESAIMPLLTFVGGPGAVGPTGKGEVMIDLQEGQYIVICFIPDAQNVPHLAKGMLHPMKVTSNAGIKMAEPKADLEVPMMDFHFALPTEVKPGKQVWKVINQGPQPHEVALLKLAEGKTMEDVGKFFAKPEGAPPFEAIAGMQGLSIGKYAYLNLDLKPGTYAALCNISDPASGKAHLELGMVHLFTVK